MPSFDIVSEIDMHEATNAVDQANREIDSRFDFKGSNAKFELQDNTVTMRAPEAFQCKQMLEILQNKLVKRQIDIRCLEIAEPEVALNAARQSVTLRSGIETPLAKKIIKLIKDAKMKVQTAIQGDKVRVTGKKRDDLQAAIALLREADVDLPLQYINFRD